MECAVTLRPPQIKVVSRGLEGRPHEMFCNTASVRRPTYRSSRVTAVKDVKGRTHRIFSKSFHPIFTASSSVDSFHSIRFQHLNSSRSLVTSPTPQPQTSVSFPERGKQQKELSHPKPAHSFTTETPNLLPSPHGEKEASAGNGCKTISCLGCQGGCLSEVLFSFRSTLGF